MSWGGTETNGRGCFAWEILTVFFFQQTDAEFGSCRPARPVMGISSPILVILQNVGQQPLIEIFWPPNSKIISYSFKPARSAALPGITAGSPKVSRTISAP